MLHSYADVHFEYDQGMLSDDLCLQSNLNDLHDCSQENDPCFLCHFAGMPAAMQRLFNIRMPLGVPMPPGDKIPNKLPPGDHKLNKRPSGGLLAPSNELECTHCGQMFTNVSRLKRHYNKHMGVKPHQCHFCHKAFGRKDILQEHIRIHTGERPYKCDICGKGFTQNHAMLSHRERVCQGKGQGNANTTD